MERIQFAGRSVAGFGVGAIGQPDDWYYTRLVLPDDVREAKRRVDARFQTVNVDVVKCANLTADERSAWYAVFTAWRKFFCNSEVATCPEPAASFFSAGGEMDDVERYEKYAYDWQKKLDARKCTVSGSIEKPDIVKRKESENRSETIGTVKTIAVAVAVTAGIVYLVPVIARLIPGKK